MYNDRPPRQDFDVVCGDRPPRSGGFGGAGGADRQMFDTTCTRCGQATQVPFKPTAGRDVFCRDCFRSANPR